MQTKLSRFSGAIMEAAWLAAAIVVPLLFNVYSVRVFEPEKITLMRSLGLVILGAWIIKSLDKIQGVPAQISISKEKLLRFFKRPLVLPVFAFAFVYLLATLFSIAPEKSLWGSYQRLEGAYTTLSYLVIFAAIAVNLRHRSQMERLLTTIILVSLPVCIYGLLQRFSLDPIPWGDATARIASTLGNPIFLGAYLIMVFPLTLVRGFESFSAFTSGGEERISNLARLLLYALLAILQLTTLILSGSRGPVLGWLAGSAFFIFLLSLLWQQRWLTMASIGSFLLILLFLILFNLQVGPLQSLRARPGFGRLGELANAGSVTGRVRTLIWNGSVDLIKQHPPLQVPGGTEDEFNVLRPLLGYGPESMYLVFPRFYPPELVEVEKRNAIPDRAHNETWDALINEGLFGLLVYLGLYASILYFVLKWLGLIPKLADVRWFWLGTLVGLAVGAFLSVLIGGVAWLGIGLPLGLLLGFTIYLLRVAMIGGYDFPKTRQERNRALILLGLIAGIISHLIEINFGIAIAATRLYFWMFVALMLVAGEFLPAVEEASTVEKEPARVQQIEKFKPALASGITSGILLSTISYDLITHLQGGSSALEILWRSLARAKTPAVPSSSSVLWLLIVTWFVTGLFLALELKGPLGSLRFQGNFASIMTVSALLSLAFMLLHAAWIASASSIPPKNPSAALAQAALFEKLILNYWLYLFILLILLTTVLVRDWPARFSKLSPSAALLALIFIFLIFFFAQRKNLRPIQADVAANQANLLSKSKSWSESIALFQQAIELAPKEDEYYLELGQTYLDTSGSTTDEAEKEAWILQAQDSFSEARLINPLNPDHLARLAQSYRIWADIAPDQKTRLARGEISSGYYSQATTLSPNNASLWDDWAILYLNTLEDPGSALPLLERALELDPNFDLTHALLGQYYSAVAENTSDRSSQTAAQRRALAEYQQAIQLADPKDTAARYRYTLLLAGSYVSAGLPEQAIRYYESALRISPDTENRWKIEEILARLYYDNGDMKNALLHGTNALASAPEDQNERLRTMIEQFQEKP